MLLVLEEVSLSDVRRGGGSVFESISASYSVGIIYLYWLFGSLRLDFGQMMIMYADAVCPEKSKSPAL